MSWQAVDWALRKSPRLFTKKGLPDSSARSVLVILCEHAREDGSNAKPSVHLIEYESDLSERTVRDALGRVSKAGLITDVGKTAGGVTIWQINMHLVRSETDLDDFMAQVEQRKLDEAKRSQLKRDKAKSDKPGLEQPVADARTAPESIEVQREIPVAEETPRPENVSGRPEILSGRPADFSGRPERAAPRTVSEPPTEPQRTPTGGSLPPDPPRIVTATPPRNEKLGTSSGPSTPAQDHVGDSLPRARTRVSLKRPELRFNAAPPSLRDVLADLYVPEPTKASESTPPATGGDDDKTAPKTSPEDLELAKTVAA